jgi:hypothetical protein
MGSDGAPCPSCRRRPLYGGELGVGVVKDDVDLKMPIERAGLEGREAHVAPGVPTTTEILVTSSVTRPPPLINTGRPGVKLKVHRGQVPDRVPVDCLADEVREQ